MGLIVWLIFGGIVGWLANIITRSQQGIFVNIIIGIVGAFIGGFFSALLTGDPEPYSLFDLGSWLLSTLGASALLLVAKLFRRSNPNSNSLDPKLPPRQAGNRLATQRGHPERTDNQRDVSQNSANKPATDGQSQVANSVVKSVAAPQEQEPVEENVGFRVSSDPYRVTAQPSAGLSPPAKSQNVSSQQANQELIFLSYRRDDTADVTGRIYDRLVQRFGEETIFKDVDAIPLGVDFRQQLSHSVGKCSMLLAIIGRQWLSIESRPRHRRLDDHRDFVRIEIEAALQRDIPIIPLLVQGASMPSEEELPPSLQNLAYRNGVAIRPDPDFHRDMERLIHGIERHLRQERERT